MESYPPPEQASGATNVICDDYTLLADAFANGNEILMESTA